MSQGNVAVTAPTIADQGRRRWVIPLVACLAVFAFPAILDGAPVTGGALTDLIPAVLFDPLAESVPALLPIAKLLLLGVAVAGLLGVRHHPRIILGYYAAILVVIALTQNAADLGDRGFALITGNAVGQLIVGTMAFIGLRSATDNSTLRRGRLWVTPLMALAWLYPFVLDDGVVRPGLDVFNGAGVTYCMVTPVIAGLLFLRPDGFARTTGLAVGALGVVFGLLNLTTWWIAHPENWWMGVLHVPLFVVSLALAVTSARRAR